MKIDSGHIVPFCLLNLVFLLFSNSYCSAWGFFAHKKINQLAIYTLPPPLCGFYKDHVQYLIEQSVAPDKRRYLIPSEGPRHYIDLDSYQLFGSSTFPLRLDTVKKWYSDEEISSFGILPWSLMQETDRLYWAFYHRDWSRVLRISAELGHYLADATVPLHTTSNYNGQFTNQYGIHGLWETSIPETYFEHWFLTTGPASYLEDPNQAIRNMIINTNSLVDTVLEMEARADSICLGRKYGSKTRSGRTVSSYNESFVKVYYEQLDGMVQRQMKVAIKIIGSIWYTCWVQAGQPALPDSWKVQKEAKSKGNSPSKAIQGRDHE